MADDPRIILNPDGTIADANEAALALYALPLAELLAAPAGAFSAEPQTAEEQAAFRKAWESEGQPDLVGEATIRRLDGTARRVSFGITQLDDGRFGALLRPLDAETTESTQVFTAGQVLARWRAAERELEAVPPESPEASLITREIERFRQAYQQIFQSRGDGSPA